MGREKMHQPGYFKSFTRANVTIVLPQDSTFVASCCYQSPSRAKAKPALCLSVLPLKAWLYSAWIWQSRSFFLMHLGLSFLAGSGRIQRAGLHGMPVVLMLFLAIPDPRSPPNLGCKRPRSPG